MFPFTFFLFRGSKRKIFTFFRTLICEKVLKDLGVFGDIKLNTYTLDLIPFDYDVLSMELPLCYKECNLVCFLVLT
jgi:hypothetical protein